MRKRVLLVVPKSFPDSNFTYLGSTKDIQGRIEYFKQREIEYRILVHDKTEQRALEAVQSVDLAPFSHIVIEKCNYPAVFKYLRQHCASQTKILYRSHNAEILHRLDYIWCYVKKKKFGKAYEGLASLNEFTRRDISAARRTDYVLSISDWEKDHYWKRLWPRAKVEYVPFFLGEDYLTEINPTKKIKQCLCFTSTHGGPIIEDSVYNFLFSLKGLGSDVLKRWEFVVSGRYSSVLKEFNKSFSGSLRSKFYESPYEALADASCVVLFSDAGRGFKTKLLEAVESNCHILVTKGVFKRLAPELQLVAKVVNLNEAKSFESKLLEIEAEPHPSSINARLREQAFQALDQVFAT